MQLKQDIPMQRVMVPFLVFTIATVVYSQYGFHGQLTKDAAISLYSGQRMAEGVPPYISIFVNWGPLSSMLAGLGVMVAKQLGWNDIFTVRLVFFIVSCFTVVSVYLLGQSLFQSKRVGFFGVLLFLGFSCFAKKAASGPCFKTPMVLFETLSLLLASQSKWFGAGLCGSLSFLTWQPAAIFPLVTLLLAATQPRKERLPAILSALVGIGLPIAIIVVYFHYHGALKEFLDGVILFNIRYLHRPPSSVISHFWAPLNAILTGYRTMALPILTGFITLAYIYRWRRSLHRSLKDTLTKDSYAPILLSFPALVIWSLIDFQGCPDFYVFLPYLAIAFGYFLDRLVHRVERSRIISPHEGIRWVLIMGVCIALITLAGVGAHRGRESTLIKQMQAVMEMENRFGKDAKLLSIGVPEVLVLLHRTNPTPYVLIVSGMDRLIDANIRGGFERWFRKLKVYDPDVIVYKTVGGIYAYKLRRWLKFHYHEEQLGPWRVFEWRVFVRNTRLAPKQTLDKVPGRTQRARGDVFESE